MSRMSFITMTTGCSDTRIEDIDTYYLLRVADKSGTKADIVYVNNKNHVKNHDDIVCHPL